jgi:hypothetical protein
MEHLWKPLYPKIRELLKDLPILQTWKGRIFKRPSELRYLTPDTLHRGAPIFDDLLNERYLAPEYGERNKVLEEFGVQKIRWSDLLDRLEADLKNSHSKMRSLAPDDEWHVSCAALLLSGLEFEGIRQMIKRMAIIPLPGSSGGSQWHTAPTTKFGGLCMIYFPSTDGVPIPENLSLSLVEARAASIPKRAALFRKLGVQDCPRQTVIDKIRYTQEHLSEGANHWNVPPSHLRYLFHFHTNPESLRTWLVVPTEAGYLRKASHQLYFLSDDIYHTQRLLAKGCETKENGPATFIRRNVVEFESPDVRRQNLSWIEWLKRATGARYFPPLVEDLSASELSPVMLAVLKKSTRAFVGLLQAYWNAEYESTILELPWISSRLGNCRVFCESKEVLQLRSTFLPSNEIKAKAGELGVENEFPFLMLPVTLTRTNYRNWQFLEDLGVGHKVDLRFYKLVLEKMKSSDNVAPEKVADVYRCMAKIVQLEEQENLR